MSPLLIKAVVAITLALIFYTIGVWSEHRARVLKPFHLAFFWLGLVMDVIGTRMMSVISASNKAMSQDVQNQAVLLADQQQSAMMNIHGITGVIAIVLMCIHAVWATVVLARNNEKAKQIFHRFSIAVWVIWLIPFVIGMVMGMKG